MPSNGLARTRGFLAERLAVAAAVPEEERNADVRAFVETCALQEELTEELGLSLAEELSVHIMERATRSRWTAAAALKFFRSHFIIPGSPLEHSPQLHFYAGIMLFQETSMSRTGTTPPDLGQEWADILEGDPCLRNCAVLAAGLPAVSGKGEGLFWEEGLLKMCNRVVALMQRPAVLRRLRAELAALPEALVSYEELLAFFVEFGVRMAFVLVKMGEHASTADIVTSMNLAGQLLPLLAPDNPCLRQKLASIGKANLLPSYLTTLVTALDVARQQGSDYYVAACGYEAAEAVNFWVSEAAARQPLPPPSVVLGWLQEAEAAHRRCKALLPKQWTQDLDIFKAAAVPAKPSLLRLQQEGDRWRRLSAAELQELDAGQKAGIERDRTPYHVTLGCSGCGRAAAQLRRCAACRGAQYCSVECQRAHWREHKARCKEVQAAKAAAPAGAASGSGS